MSDVDLFKYYTVQLKPVFDETQPEVAQYDANGELVCHQHPLCGVTSEVKLIKIPVGDAARVSVHPETDYGMTIIPVEDNFQLGFYKLKLAQLSTLLNKYTAAVEAATAAGVDVVEASANLRDKIRFLSQYECETPSEDMQEHQMPKPVSESKDRWFKARQTWVKNEEGRYDASGWRDANGEYLPDNVNLMSIDKFTKIDSRYGVMEVPSEATFCYVPTEASATCSVPVGTVTNHAEA